LCSAKEKAQVHILYMYNGHTRLKVCKACRHKDHKKVQKVTL